MFKTEFDFTLPKGYLDGEGNLHRKGIMRMAKAIDEIVPMRDPRVKSNAAYATVLILARVITRLGALEDINPRVIEELYACDLNYLYDLYQEINGSEEQKAVSQTSATQASPTLETNTQDEMPRVENEVEIEENAEVLQPV